MERHRYFEYPKPPRKWYQFSIRAYLLFFVLVSICLSLVTSYVYRAEKQKKTVRWINSHGGQVYYDYQVSRSGQVKRRKNKDPNDPSGQWLRDMIGVNYVSSLSFIEFEEKTVSDDEIKSLERSLPDCEIRVYHNGQRYFHSKKRPPQKFPSSL